MNESVLVTVIIAVFNGEATLERAINSFVSQEFSNKELIIIDGGSTDSTINIIQKYESVVDYWISEKDQGIADAWNKGINNAKGEWILFLGADDYFCDNFSIEKASEYLESNSSYDLVFGKVCLVNTNNKFIKSIGTKWDWNFFRRWMSIPHQGTFHSKKLFEEIGLFDINLEIVSDYELILRKKEKLKAFFIEEYVSNMQVGGISQRAVQKVHREWLFVQLRHKVDKKIKIYINYFLISLKYKVKQTLNIFKRESM